MSQGLQFHQSVEEGEEHLVEVEDAVGAEVEDMVGVAVGVEVEDVEHPVQRVIQMTQLSPQM